MINIYYSEKCKYKNHKSILGPEDIVYVFPGLVPNNDIIGFAAFVCAVEGELYSDYLRF